MDAVRHYADEGFGGVVMKSHHHSTVMELIALRDAFPEGLPVPAFGGVALNGAVGGLNPRAVELALGMGGRIVWFPTIAGRAHQEWERRARARLPVVVDPPLGRGAGRRARRRPASPRGR